MKLKNKEEVIEEQKESKKEENIETTKTTAKDVIKSTADLIFNTRIFVILVGIFIMLKTVMLYKVGMGCPSLRNEDIIMNLTFILVFLTLPMLFNGKIRFWLTLIVDLIISTLLFVNELYYSYSSNLVSISQISNLRYGREISASLPVLLHLKQIWYFIDIIILIILFAIKKIKIRKQSRKTYIVGIVYAIIVLLLTLTRISVWVKEADRHQYNKILQIKAASIYGYHYLDLKRNINMKKSVKYKTYDSMISDYNNLKDTYKEKYSMIYDFKDIAKDKNVIVVQLESVQNFVVGRKMNGKEITPNLNKFLNENIEFTNMHNQSYSSTADSEFTFVNSVYPLENGMCFAQYPSNDYNNIFENYKNDGYITAYMHGNEGGFWNRQAVYSRLPIDHLIFDDVYPEGTERISNFISDEQVYKKAIEEMKSYDGKFFMNIVTASSHTPFDLEGIVDKDKKVNIDVGDEYRGIYFVDYIESINYADYAFGLFIDQLKEAGLYEDSVILIYGDHAGLQMYNYEMQDFIKEEKSMNDVQIQMNYSNILCGLRIPGVDHMQINTPTVKLDMKPTLMQICGIEDKFSLGESMFSNKNFIGLNNGKIITDKYFYDADWYEISSGNKINLDDLPEEEAKKLQEYSEIMQKELDISLSINILNLLKRTQIRGN